MIDLRIAAEVMALLSNLYRKMTSCHPYFLICLINVILLSGVTVDQVRKFCGRGGAFVESMPFDGGSRVRIPLKPPRRDLRRVLHLQLPVALSRSSA